MVHTQVDKWKAQLKQLQGRMEEVSADVRMEIQEQIDNLQHKIDQYT